MVIFRQAKAPGETRVALLGMSGEGFTDGNLDEE